MLGGSRFSFASNPQVEITPWKNNAKGAYSLIHDDLCRPHSDGIFDFADPIAFSHDIPFGVGAIVGSCVYRAEEISEKMQRLKSHNHEFIAHSWNHASSVELDWKKSEWDVNKDVIETKMVLERMVPGLTVDYFIFPYDAYNDRRLKELKQAGYLGARAGKEMYEDRGVNVIFDNFDPFRANFDVYMSKKEQDTINAGKNPHPVSKYNDDNDDIELQHAQAAIDQNGWSLQEFHSVYDDSVENESYNGWAPISLRHYRRLIMFLSEKKKDNSLWVDTPTQVTKYIMTKKYVRNIVLKDSYIRFSMDPDSDTRYESKVTVKLKLVKTLKKLTQNSVSIPFQKTSIKNEYIFDVSPFQGDIAVAFE